MLVPSDNPFYLLCAFLPAIAFIGWVGYIIWIISGVAKQFFQFFMMYVDLYGIDKNPIKSIRTIWASWRENQRLKVVYDDLMAIRSDIVRQLDQNENTDSMDSADVELMLLGELARVEGSIKRAWDARTGKTEDGAK